MARWGDEDAAVRRVDSAMNVAYSRPSAPKPPSFSEPHDPIFDLSLLRMWVPCTTGTAHV